MGSARRVSRVGAVVTALLVVLAVLWWAFVIPALVKYPTNVNASPHYEGTFTLFVNPTTAAPLATPTSVPMTIDRHIQAVGKQSGANRVLVTETIKQQAGTLLNVTQTNAYVMDRRTLKNVSDPRAYAFEPSNLVDRSGAYRLNLPFGINTTKAYPIYKNEIGTTYTMQANTTVRTVHEAGLKLDSFAGSMAPKPLSPAYLAELNKVVPLPMALTLDQLKPQLKAAGFDVDATLAALTPVLTPADVATLAQLAAKPIPLQYVLSFNGQAAVEPTTGAEVDVGATESLGVQPQLTDVPTLQAILGHYPNVSQAATASAALGALTTAAPIKLIEYQYKQTPASVADIAKTVKKNRQQVLLAQRYIPLGLLALALVSLLVTGFGWFRGRPAPSVDLRSAHRPVEPGQPGRSAGKAA